MDIVGRGLQEFVGKKSIHIVTPFPGPILTFFQYLSGRYKLVLKSYKAFHRIGQAKFAKFEPIYTTIPAASKKDARLKSGHN
jgi:hypothetical protein